MPLLPAAGSSAALAVLLAACVGGGLWGAAAMAPAVAEPAAAVAAVAPVEEPAAAPEPALSRTGTTQDGWAVYRLAPGRLPDRLAVGEGFRGDITWQAGGLVRKARVYVPRSAPASAPLLVSLHGLGSSLRKVEQQQRWSTLAFQQEFVAVWAAGHRGSWNAGPCCGDAVRDGVDDLGYLDRLREVVGALHGVDDRRVHLAGFSNGAMLALRYACGRPGEVAGVLSVAGTHTAPCTPSAPTAVLQVHGALDPTVPVDGTAFSDTLGSPLPPPRDVVRQWAATGAAVRSVVLPGVGHSWPTRATGGYDTTGEGWRFLEEHPLPERPR